LKTYSETNHFLGLFIHSFWEIFFIKTLDSGDSGKIFIFAHVRILSFFIQRSKIRRVVVFLLICGCLFIYLKLLFQIVNRIGSVLRKNIGYVFSGGKKRLAYP